MWYTSVLRFIGGVSLAGYPQIEQMLIIIIGAAYIVIIFNYSLKKIGECTHTPVNNKI